MDREYKQAQANYAQAAKRALEVGAIENPDALKIKIIPENKF
ncbi:MAG: hypothetical protein AABX90_01895 [Nanoarchaeota archaeon]